MVSHIPFPQYAEKTVNKIDKNTGITLTTANGAVLIVSIRAISANKSSGRIDARGSVVTSSVVD